LGGGIVPGSVILIGGDPGIGKSTLMLQVLDILSKKGLICLYLSGEESLQQIKMRAERLKIDASDLYIATGTNLEELLETIKLIKPSILVVDSIQTLYTDTIASAPGSMAQLRETSYRLQIVAKQSGISMFLIGHVTKEGLIAGPKVLEHLVDTVLYFEGDSNHLYRILRSVKNRYGPTNEIGVFEMKDTGLHQVSNPSKIFLEQRPEKVSGSVVVPCMEGTRPVFLEIQALVSPSHLGVPRRTTVGVDHNRVSLLVAVLWKRLGLRLGDHDIFVNVAGGIKVDEPAVDLGIVTAIISSLLDKPVDRDMILFGEVGLAGEVRGVNNPELRIKEAVKLGFSKCITAKAGLRGKISEFPIEILEIDSVQQLFDLLF
ncbi:MAG: DNA repair protein RadA, partial [Deltaproteobacteria bacterium]